jgi:hypothetical protein
MPQPLRPLPANRAFVVQFRAQAAGEPPCCQGRAEHLASGQAARLASRDELWAFIRHILMEVQNDPDAR